MKMAATIYDVAKKAGVSTATVSRVINKLGNVRQETKAKVEEAMEQLNFTPNVLAQSFATNKSNIIGLVTTLESERNISNEMVNNFYFTELFRGINTVLKRRNYDLLIINESLDNTQYYDGLIQNKRIDGLVVSTQLHNTAQFKKLVRQKLPLAYIGKIPNFNQGLSVYARYYKYTDEILGYLNDKGFERVLFISYRQKQDLIKMWDQLKYDNHTKMDIEYLDLYEAHQNGGLVEKIKDIYQDGNYPRAIFTDELNNVQIIISVLNNLGLQVPKDVSIVSVEHIHGMGNNYYPKITNVYVPVYDMGVAVANLLIDFIEQNQQEYNKQIILESILIERESVKKG